jgi:hypothetical protein
LGDKRNRRDAGKLPHQVTQHLYLLGPTSVYRHQDRVDRALPDYADRLGDRIPVNHSEAAAAGRVHPRPLDGQQDRGDGRRPPFI